MGSCFLGADWDNIGSDYFGYHHRSRGYSFLVSNDEKNQEYPNISEHVLESLNGITTIQGFQAAPAFIEPYARTKRGLTTISTQTGTIVYPTARGFIWWHIRIFLLLYFGAPLLEKWNLDRWKHCDIHCSSGGDRSLYAFVGLDAIDLAWSCRGGSCDGTIGCRSQLSGRGQWTNVAQRCGAHHQNRRTLFCISLMIQTPTFAR